MELETAQVAALHFVKLTMFRQQREVTARNTFRGGNYPIQADCGGNPETTTTQVTVHQVAGLRIGRQQ